MPRLVRIVVLAGLLGAVAAPVTLGAVPAVVVPIPVTPVACRELSPVLLSAGARPRARVRLDLRTVQSRSGRSVETEQVRTMTRFPGSSSVSTVMQTRRIAATLTARRLAHGHLPFSGHLVVTFPGATPARRPLTAELGGYFTPVNGGVVGPTASGAGGSAVNDHLPLQPLGIGARWRVVNCEPIYDTPARETRIYTLRSLAHGVLTTTYRDDIELDPAKVDLGSSLLGGVKVQLRLLALQGSSTGTERIPLANGFGEHDHTVSKVSFSLRASATGHAPIVLRSSVVDVDTQVPVG
jgi:hypothetical protein